MVFSQFSETPRPFRCRRPGRTAGSLRLDQLSLKAQTDLKGLEEGGKEGGSMTAPPPPNVWASLEDRPADQPGVTCSLL